MDPIKKLEKIVQEMGLTPQQAAKVLKASQVDEPQRGVQKKLPYNSKRVRVGVLSDLHLGHKQYMPNVLEHAAKNFKRQKVDFVMIPGDILEGMSGREGHIYELSHIGASAQLDYGVEQLSQIEQPIFAITATNSHDGWYNSKNNAGFHIGPELERRLGKDKFNFLGYDEADLILDSGLTLRIVHPGDGTAYAISYKMQKYLNALSGGKKPHVVFQGHYHKWNAMFYRGVHAFDAGTLCGQTIFMKKKQTPAHVCYSVHDIWGNERGVDRIRTELVPFYE
jgi:predicted phosphodiesterase